jgi:glycosyltransferase involved in cell wall biosynthesis
MKKRIGVSAARNTGINLANSTYIAFLDDDDEWLTDKLKLQMKFMLANKIQASTTNFLFQDGVKSRVFPEQSPDQVKRDLLRRCHCGPGSTLVIEKKIVLELGNFSTDLERYEDWLFMINLKLKKYSYEHFDKVTAIVHRIDNSWKNNETAIHHLNRKLSAFEWTTSTEISNGILFEKAVNFKRSKNYPQTLFTIIQWIAGYPPNICYLLGRIKFRLIHRFLPREP